MERCEHHQILESEVSNIKKILYGNGRAGLLERISRIETKLTMLTWITGVMTSAVVAGTIKLILG